MAEQTLKVARLFPDGTVVGAYDAEGYSQFPNVVPGPAVSSATVAGGKVTFTGLESNHPYFAAAQVGGVWRNVQFIPNAQTPGGGGGGGLSEAEVAGIAQAKVATETTAREAADSGLVTKAERGASAMGTVYHGASGGTARPTGYAFITWIGTAEPTHAAEHDIWIKG